MDATARRKALADALTWGEEPQSAGSLAQKLGVSRQAIMGDVSILRAKGLPITATPRGYILAPRETGLTAPVSCAHSARDMARELYLMVDNGCEVVDVVVEHPVYGQLTGALGLKSRYDVDRFLDRCAKASPLSALTGGRHLHTLRFPDQETFRRTAEALAEAGFLYQD